MSKTIKLKITSDFITGHPAGSEVKIKVDKNNIPLDRFWRQRLIDAETDNCCCLIKENKKKEESK